MRYLLIFIIFAIVGFFLTFFIINKRTTQDIRKPKSALTPQSSKFSLENAPADSLHADITTMSGEIKWTSRTATEGAVITSRRSLYQGESIGSGDKSEVSFAFPDMLITLSEKTTLNIIQTHPDNFLLEQKSGKSAYKTTSSTPLGIRISPLLVQLNNGRIEVSKDDDLNTISVNVLDGSATVAYNDTDIFSNVKQITKDQILTFDINTRTAKIK